MRSELEQKLVERWLDWFEIHGDPRKTAMVRGFECGDGWFALLLALCERIEPLVQELNATLPEGERFRVEQVKQKFGALRFHTSHRTDAMNAEISRAQQESERTCERCGSPAVLNWETAVTLCDECLRTYGLKQA